MQQVITVLTNAADADTAHAIARRIVEEGLAACVNVLPGLHSIYRWKGAVEEADEVMLLIKTVQSRYAELEAVVKSMHPYELPEIIALPVASGFPPYLAWIEQETQKHANI